MTGSEGLMRVITYRRFDVDGRVTSERPGEVTRTLREAMDVLRREGFRPMVDDHRKLHRCWTDGRGTVAYVS